MGTQKQEQESYMEVLQYYKIGKIQVLPSLNTPKDTISPGGEPWYQYFNVVAILCAAKMAPNCFPVAVSSSRVATNSLFTHSL